MLRHALERPDDAREQEVGIEGAQGELNGVLLVVAEGADDQPEGHAADSLQDGQQDHPDHGSTCRHLQYAKITKLGKIVFHCLQNWR